MLAFSLRVRSWWSLLLVATLVFVGLSGQARAEGAAPRGVAVVGAGAPSDAAWALARQIYASPSLRPSFGEPTARALATGAHVDADTAELAELRAAVRDQGAVSRGVLSSLVTRLHVRAVVVVRAEDESSSRLDVRLFDGADGAFDAAEYAGEGTDESWRADVVRSLSRRLDPAASAASPPAPKAAAAKPAHTDDATGPRPFYRSPWFWAALGAAVAVGGTAFAISRVTANDDVLVRVEPPATSSAALTFRGP